ncbi:MAG: transglycosylase SLT domain-containing protein [Sandaracinaceae bacterium]
MRGLAQRWAVSAFAFAFACASSAGAQDVVPSSIADAVRRHDDVAALEALDALPRSRAAARAYLRARLLDRLGRYAEAAAGYPIDDGALPDAIRRDARARAAAAFVRAGDCEHAAPLLDAIGDPLSRGRQAECAIAAGRLEEARTMLTALVRANHGALDNFAVRRELAEVEARLGHASDAVDRLTALVVERAEHPDAERARRLAEELNGGPLTLSTTQRLRRVEGLLSAHRFEQAVAESAEIETPTAPADLRHYLHVRGTALFRERHHYAEAAEVLARSARAGGAYAVEDELTRARALGRAGDRAAALSAYRAFVRAHAGHPSAAEASYLAAELELERGGRRADRAMRRFVDSPIARRHEGLLRDATWRIALHAFETGRAREAIRWLERYAASDGDVLVRARGFYWLGRARARAHDRRGAIAAYREALYVEPLHYYALLARQRLEEMHEETPPPFPEPAETDDEPAPSVELPEEVAFLAELGLTTDAAEALRAHEAELRRRGGVRGIVSAYHQLGDASRAMRLLGASVARRRTAPGTADRWRWDAAYPRPFEDAARAASRGIELEPAHLYAVMRQESAYDFEAVSYADAIGLMQLLPATADRVARGLGLEIEREHLFDPALNVRLGATYLDGLASRLGIPLAFAAYNAGGHRVQAWLEASGRTELDLFVEHIPYEQTRNYIRRVTTHYAHYRYLEDPERGWPLTLPTHVEPR